MLNVKYLAHVFWEMARVYCELKVRAYLQDYYHCYSFLVDNYLKKTKQKNIFSYHYNRIKKYRVKKSQAKTFSTLVHLPLSFSLQFTPPPTTPLPIMAYLLFPFHFPHSCSPPISSSLVHFLFFFTSPSN